MPTSIPENEILNSIQTQYKSCLTVKRFMRNASPMPVIQVNFSTSEDCQSIIANGLRLTNLFLMAEKFIQMKQPTRCFNCNGYGHTAAWCKTKTRCGKCADDHKTNECTNSLKKCSNCNNNHHAFDKNCPMFISKLEKINSPFLQ